MRPTPRRRLPVRAPSPRSVGVSLVELLVGVCIAGLLAASTTTLLADNLREHRTLLLESRLTQGLRHAADAMARDWRDARDDAVQPVLSADGQPESYRLRAGVLEQRTQANRWRALTDPATVEVTEFKVNASIQDLALPGPCATPCPGGAAECAAHQAVRSLALVLSGHLVGDASLTRSVHSQVRLRNDALHLDCAG